MSRLTLVACALLVLSLADPARAAEPVDGDEATAQLDALYEAGQWGELLLRAPAWAQQFPDHAGPRYYNGLMLLTTNRFDLAAAELRSARELAPEFAQVHLLLGRTLVALEDDASARSAFERVAELDPDLAGLAAQDLEELDLRERLRADPTPEVPPASTPEETVHALITQTIAGHLEQAIEQYVDPEAIAPAYHDRRPSSEAKTRKQFALGFYEGQERRESDLIGWEIGSSEPIEEGKARVAATLLYRQSITEEDLRLRLKLLDSPLGEQAIGSDARSILLSLPRDQVTAAFQRQMGRPIQGFARVRFELHSRSGDWKVADVSAETDDGGRVELSLLTRDAGRLSELVGDPDGLADRRARTIGRVVGFLAIPLALLIFVLVTARSAMRR